MRRHVDTKTATDRLIQIIAAGLAKTPAQGQRRAISKQALFICHWQGGERGKAGSQFTTSSLTVVFFLTKFVISRNYKIWLIDTPR